MSETLETIEPYLRTVTSIVSEIAGESLTGLYLHGSAVQQDFDPRVSDIDILGILSGSIDQNARQSLTERLNHAVSPCPAQGFEFILCTAEAVQAPVFAMPFEFALSTGPHWPLEFEHSGTISDTLIHLTLCRQSGMTLFGPPPTTLIAPVPVALLRQALVAEIEWHLSDVDTSFDRAAQRNAVLNAARSVSAAETGYILSKSEGARQWNPTDPFADQVRRALNSRAGQDSELGVEEIKAFLKRAKAVIEALPETR